MDGSIGVESNEKGGNGIDIHEDNKKIKSRQVSLHLL